MYGLDFSGGEKEIGDSMKKAKRMRGEVRQQVGVLPVRRNEAGEPELLLVTTRTTRRWIIPKGWPISGLKDHEAAAQEAFEEAGVVGRVQRKSFGRYMYWKRMSDHFALCRVTAFRLDADGQLDDWAEKAQRQCHWFKLDDAAELVDEPGLKALIRKLAEAIGPAKMSVPPSSQAADPSLAHQTN